MKKLLSVLMLIAALIVPLASNSQSLYEYTLQTGTTTYTSIANADSLLSSVTGDAGTQVVNLPFYFPFGEDTYNSVTVRADGYLYFGTTSPGHSCKSAWTSTTNYSLIAPLITYDGKITASGATSGAYKAYMADDTGNMMMVIEFKSVMCYYSDYGNYNYQIRLYPNGNISVVYGTNTATTNSSMVHNFFLINGISDKICLTGTFASPTTSSTVSALPDLSTMPANGRVITYVRPIVTCPKPLSINATTTFDEMTLFWTPGGTESEWEVVVGGNTYYCTDTFYTVNNLNDNTLYNVSVRAICGAGDTSGYRSGSFRTACVPVDSLPWVYAFEDASGSGSAATINTCLGRHVQGTTTAFPYPSTTHYDGSYSLYMYSSSSAYSWLTLPLFDEDLDQLQISFRAYRSTTSTYGHWAVGVMTNPSDITTFDTIASGQVSANSTWELVEVPLMNYTGTGTYLAILCPKSTTTNYTYIDHLVVDYLPTCLTPIGVAADTVTANTADLSWTSTASEFILEYGPAGFTQGHGTVVTASSNAITLNGLAVGTTYGVYVTSVCGTDTSNTAYGTFTTACSELTTGDLPWTQTFEGAPTGGSTNASFVNCMNRLNNGTTYYGYPYVASSSSYNVTPGGTKGLYWYNSTTTGSYGDYQCVVLPAIDTIAYPINNLQLRFWARATSTSYHPVFQVGVMTDPTNINSFQTVRTVDVGTNTTYAEFSVPFGTFSGHGQYIAIKAVRPTSSWYATVDDITIETIPTCPPITNLAAVGTASSALLTWDYMEGYPAPAGYTITYDSVNSTGTPASVTSSSNYVTLTGLVAGTTYKAVVRADCSGGDLGRADSIVFALSSGNTIDFDGGTTTSEQLPVNNYWNYSYTQQLITAAEMGNAPVTITGIDFQYAYSSPSTEKTSVTIYMANTTTSSLSSAFVPYSSSTFQVVYTGNLNCSTGWNHFQFTNPFNYNGTGNLLIAINDNSGDYDGIDYTFYTHSATGKARVDYNDDNPYILTSYSATDNVESLNYRSNMKLCIVSTGSIGCVAPAVGVANVTATSVDVVWAPGNDETAWDVDYRIEGATAWTNAASGVTTNSYTISGLDDATSYEFRVSFTCSNNNNLYANVATATTACIAKSIPYTENFDSYTTSTTAVTGVQVPCWDQIMTGTASYQTGSYLPQIYYSSTYANSGNYSLRLNGVGYHMLPEMSVSLDSLILSFSRYTTSTSYGLIVGVMEAGSFLPIDTIATTASQHIYYEVDFHNYHGTSRTIAFRNYYTTSTSTYYSYSYIDDITVFMRSNCPRVSNVSSRNITQTEATITWDTTAANDYEVQYGPSGFTLGTGTSVVAYGADTIDITGLASNSAYDVYVRGICTADTGVWSFSYTFRTNCGMIDTMPFTENFESYPIYSSSSTSTPFIPCWTRLNDGTTYGGVPYISGSTASYNHTPGGSKYVYWYNTTSTTYGNYMYMILPQIDTTVLPINTLQLSFWGKTSSTSYNHVFQVGVMNNNTDTNFYPVDTVSIAGSTTWTEYLVNFAGYTGSGSYIALRVLRGAGTTSYAYLDDFTLDLIPACPRVEDLTISNILLDSATVTWTDATNTAWYVEYDTVPFTPGTGHMTPVSTTTTSCVLGGLDSATLYYVYVYPDCGTDVFYRNTTFTTLAASPATIPYACDFEAAGLNGWDILNGSQTNQWFIGNATASSGGSRSLYISDNGGTGNSYTISTTSNVFATRTINFSTAGEYAISYDWHNQGESCCDYIRVFLAPTSASLVPGNTSGINSTGAPAGWIALDGGDKLNMDSTWQTRTEVFQITTPNTYKLVFFWHNDGSVGTQPPAAIDNISLIQNTCPMPADLICTNVGETNLSFSWTPGGSETQWAVSFNGGAWTNVTDTFYTATGLTANTEYGIQVIAICSSTDSSLATTYSTRTSCSAITLPYTETFETCTTGSSSTGSAFVNCWTRLNNGSSYGGYPYVSSSSTYNHTTGGSKGLYWYNTTTTGTYGDYQYIILPPVDTTVNPINTLQLTLWAKASSTTYNPVFHVGVMDNPSDTAMEVLGTISIAGSTTWTEYSVPLNAHVGPGQFVAIRALRPSSSWYAYVDDITLGAAPTCPHVNDVISTAASTTSITVNWTDIAGASQWQVRYGLTAATMTTVIANSHPYTINGLDALTSYLVEVRPICSAGDTGDWSQTVTLSTAMCDNASIVENWDASMTSSSSSYSPVGYSTYNYSYVQTIIDSADLAGVNGEITALAFKPVSTSAGTYFTNVDVYMANVSESNLTSSFIHPDATHQFVHVINQTDFSYTSTDWQLHGFDSAFTWDGHSNVLVAVNRRHGSWTSGSSFQAHNHSASKMRYVYQDGSAYNINTVSGGTASSTVGDIRLYSCGNTGCPAPVIASVTNDYANANITVTGSGNSFELSYGTDPAALGNTMINSTGVFFLTGLTPDQQYFFSVVQTCDSGAVSNPVSGTFTTDELPCFTPDTLEVVATSFSTATLHWISSGNATQWVIEVNGAGNQRFDTVGTNPYTIHNLYADQDYTASVRALCLTGVVESDWSDTIAFHTDVCQPVEGVNVNNITASSATASWLPTNGALGYRVSYGEYDFIEAQALRVEVDANTTSYTFTGLEAETRYEFYVQTKCGEGLFSSITQGDRIDFMTEASQGIYDVESGTLTLFPNPASTSVTLTVSGIDGKVTVEIVDLNGRKVSELRTQDSELQIDLSQIAQGAYFVRVTGDRQTAVRKLIVK